MPHLVVDKLLITWLFEKLSCQHQTALLGFRSVKQGGAMTEQIISIPVGPHAFQLCMVDGPLLNEDGTQCLAYIDYERQRILVVRDLPRDYGPAVGAAAAAQAWQRIYRRRRPAKEGGAAGGDSSGGSDPSPI
jgi:hypothetical protein